MGTLYKQDVFRYILGSSFSTKQELHSLAAIFTILVYCSHDKWTNSKGPTLLQ